LISVSKNIVAGRGAGINVNEQAVKKRGKENSRSDGDCQCEKEMEQHLLACQLIFEIEPLIPALVKNKHHFECK
jgi:hypothetical protein